MNQLLPADMKVSLPDVICFPFTLPVYPILEIKPGQERSCEEMEWENHFSHELCTLVWYSTKTLHNFTTF